MKKGFLWLCVCSMVAMLLAGCVAFPIAIPREGIWYCEELNMYLDQAAGNGVCADEAGQWQPVYTQVDYGGSCFINFARNQYISNVWKETLYTLYRESRTEDTFSLKDRNTGEIYLFRQVTEGIPPRTVLSAKGIWHCEEAGVYLDLEHRDAEFSYLVTGVIVQDGRSVRIRGLEDWCGGAVFWLVFEKPEGENLFLDSSHLELQTLFTLADTKLELEDMETGHVFTFTQTQLQSLPE